ARNCEDASAAAMYAAPADKPIHIRSPSTFENDGFIKAAKPIIPPAAVVGRRVSRKYHAALCPRNNRVSIIGTLDKKNPAFTATHSHAAPIASKRGTIINNAGTKIAAATAFDHAPRDGQP